MGMAIVAELTNEFTIEIIGSLFPFQITKTKLKVLKSFKSTIMIIVCFI
jgi:hypothetical protein